MSQSYNNGPAFQANATSVELRQNFSALLTSHAGASIPAYAEAGTVWYKNSTKETHIIKPYGAFPYNVYQVGADLLLAISVHDDNVNAYDGTTIDASVKVARNSYMSGNDFVVTFAPYSPVGGDLAVQLNQAFEPRYFAGRHWDNPIIGEPVLFSTSNYLGNKTFDTIASGDDFNEYSTGTLLNAIAFAPNTLRAVNMDKRTITLPLDLTGSTTAIDHYVWTIPSNQFAWWENQRGRVRWNLYQDGVRRRANTYKVVPFFSSSPSFVVYNIDPFDQLTWPFADAYYELEITKET